MEYYLKVKQHFPLLSTIRYQRTLFQMTGWLPTSPNISPFVGILLRGHFETNSKNLNRNLQLSYDNKLFNIASKYYSSIKEEMASVGLGLNNIPNKNMMPPYMHYPYICVSLENWLSIKCSFSPLSPLHLKLTFSTTKVNNYRLSNILGISATPTVKHC